MTKLKITHIALIASALIIAACGKDTTTNQPPTGGGGDADIEYSSKEIENLVASLPDFSYAGYEFGEKPIPEVKMKTYNVIDFGATPNDNTSDKAAIQRAIEAAEKNGAGIVLLPEGIYRINDENDKNVPLRIKGNNIVLRGQGSVELYAEKSNDPPANGAAPSIASIVNINNGNKGVAVGTIATSAPLGSHRVVFTSATSLSKGDWIQLNFQSKVRERVAKEVAPHAVENSWTGMLETDGVLVKPFHMIKSVSGNVVELYNPLTYPISDGEQWTVTRWDLQTGVGVENITFTGGMTWPYNHLAEDEGSYGWFMLRFAGVVNSWMKNCSFKDVSIGAKAINSANVSIINCKMIGNKGHNAISAQSATNTFIGACKDESGQHHTFGVAEFAINTVVWRCQSPPTTCFEAHAKQPRNSLFDCVNSGFMDSKGGGAANNLPNHLQNLILWNYNASNAKVTNFSFWQYPKRNTSYSDVTIVGGFQNQSTFDPTKGTTKTYSTGQFINPESLYEAQLKKRLGRLPQWVIDLKK